MKYFWNILVMIFLLSSCTEFLEQQPTTVLTDESAITNEASAQEVVLGMYNSLQAHGQYGIYNILVPDVLSDVLRSRSPIPNINEFDNNEVLPENVYLQNMWTHPYYSILVANQLLEKLPSLTNIPESTKTRMLAEARFIRGLSHFNLVRLFGDVPFIATTVKAEIENTSRESVDQVLQQIIEDLTAAEAGLPERQQARGEFTEEEASRVLAVRAAATALLARVYLFRASFGDYERVIQKTTEVLNNVFYELEENYGDAFKGRSKETIFEVYFAQNDPSRLNLESTPGNQFNYAASEALVNAFEEGDLRKDVLLIPSSESFYSLKYESEASPAVVLRLADIYLMRAEGRTQAGELEQALEDLNTIRSRAGLAPLEALDKDALLSAIEKERWIELAWEGHRFIDLKRTGRADAVLGAHKPDTWQTTDQLLPIPFLEVNNGLPQNPGY